MIKNATQLLDKVLADMDKLDKDELALDKANALFRGASVIINIQRMEMKYAEMRATKPELQFLDNKEKGDGV